MLFISLSIYAERIQIDSVLSFIFLILLHSEKPKLYGVLAVLSTIRLMKEDAKEIYDCSDSYISRKNVNMNVNTHTNVDYDAGQSSR